MGYPVDGVTRSAPTLWVVVTQGILVAVALAACTTHSSTQPGDGVAPITVSEVIDGDTIVLQFAGTTEETVRLLGIDTPETVDPTRPVQCFGPEASSHLSSLVPPGTQVELERDIEARDRFGRLLAYVYRSSDGLFLNAEMLSAGFADLSIFAPNNAHQETLTNALLTAQTRSAGLWGACGGADVPLDPTEYDLGDR